MGRSQRHMLWEQGATAAGEIHAEGVVAPGIAMQVDPEALNVLKPGPPLYNMPTSSGIYTREGEEPGVGVPIGEPGGPLSGSSLTGAIPEDANLPEPPELTKPVIDHLDPATAVLGDPDVTMHVHGSDFDDGCVIVFAGNDEPIVFISDTEITTIITLSLPWGAVTVPVAVRNANGDLSNEVSFTFTEAGAPEGLAERTGPFTISRIEDHPDGVAITLNEAGDVRVGDTVTIEATGNTGVNGEYTILAVDGLTIVVDNDLLLTSPVEGKGRLMVAGDR